MASGSTTFKMIWALTVGDFCGRWTLCKFEEGTTSILLVLESAMMGTMYHLLVGICANGYPFSCTLKNQTKILFVFSPNHTKIIIKWYMVNNIALYIIVKCELSQLTVFGNFLNVPPFYPSLRERIVYWKCNWIKSYPYLILWPNFKHSTKSLKLGYLYN